MTGYGSAATAYDAGYVSESSNADSCELTPAEVPCGCCEATGRHLDRPGPWAEEYDCRSCGGTGDLKTKREND